MKPSRDRDEELILHYYGESPNPPEIEARLQRSTELRQHYASLCEFLDAIEEPPIPEPSQVYGSRIWHRVAPQIESSRGSILGGRWLRPKRPWTLAAVMILLLIAAFLAGRQFPDPGAQQRAGLPYDGRERILLATVAGHLERSEVLLLELVNTQDNGDVDLTLERQLASELGVESRLYRQAARQAGRTDVASFLEQLETVLVELSHGPQTVPAADLGDLRIRLDEGDVLFKVRVLGSRLRQQAAAGRRPDEERPSALDS